MSSSVKKLNFNIMLEEDDSAEGLEGTAFKNLTAIAETNPVLAATAAALGTITSKVQNVTRLLDAHALRMVRLLDAKLFFADRGSDK